MEYRKVQAAQEKKIEESRCVTMRIMAPKKKERRVRVDKEQFDAVLSQLLKMDPIPTKQIKSYRKRSPKPLFPKSH
jgi:hypothetical protein